jgi:sugar lactone lactonase YvrE
MSAMIEAQHVLGVKHALGEGPLWNAEEQALYWVDIPNCRVCRFYPATGVHECFDVDQRITALGLRASGGLIVTAAKGFASWDPQTQALDLISAPEEVENPHVRFNDAAVDRKGRFWAGTMNEVDPAAADGCLYRLDPDGACHRVETGFTISNGVGWSPDNGTMYFTDSSRRVILAYDYDLETGAITHRRPFVHVPEEQGVPDGLTVDSEGFVWSAHWGGWKVTRYNPHGDVDREIRLPAQNVTSCAFGGENLDELYITTARFGLSEAEQAGQPLAGDLFRASVGVTGLAEPKFAG